MDIDYAGIVASIRSHMVAIRNSKEAYAGLSIEVDDEQKFGEAATYEAGKLYAVVRFGETAMNFGSSLSPVSIEVLGKANEAELTQAFLNDFASAYNLFRDGDRQEFWYAPRMASAFNSLRADFRALFTISGYVATAYQGIYLSALAYGGESVPFIAFRDSTSQQLNPQTYPGTASRTKSYATSQTYSFSVTLYLADNALVRDLLSFKYGAEDQTDKEWAITGAYSNGVSFAWSFKCQSADVDQQLGQIPTITAAFTL